MSTIHRTLAGLALILGTFSVAGCYAEAHGTTRTTGAVVETNDYEPAYYDGYVVYYDDVGHPYYYDRDRVVWVSPHSTYYVGLQNHYRVYGPRYRVWYSHGGYRYHTVRRAPGYYHHR